MAQNRTWTITQSGESRSFTISPGVGPSGPNNITTSTSTDITGILKGDGSTVSAAVEDTDYQGVLAEGAFVDGDKTKLDGIETGADVTDATNIAASITGATGKTTPVDADELPLIDSAASNVLKKLTWANLKAAIKTYYDSVTATLTNKTLTSPTINGGTATGLNNIEGSTVYGRGSLVAGSNADIDTFANGQVDFYSSTGTGFAAVAITPNSTVNHASPFYLPEVGAGADIVVDAGAQTLTDKTLTSPTINSGALSGTFSGSHSYSGQVELTGQAASGDDSAMTRELGYIEYANSPDVILTGRMLATDGATQLWQGTVTGSGSTSQATTLLQINTGATTGSTSHLRLDFTNTLLFSEDGSGGLGWCFDSKWILSFRAVINNAAANTDGYFVLGQAISTTTTTQPAVKSCGFRFHDQGVYGFVHNGSTYTESSSSLQSLSGTNVPFKYAIHNDDTNINFYINGVLVDSITAPTGATGNNKQGVNFWMDNETTTNDVSISIQGPIRFSNIRQ